MIPVPPSAAPSIIEKAGQAGKAIKGGQRVWDAASDALGIGSDHENTPLWLRQKRSKAYWQDNSADAYDAYRLNQESGLGDETSIMRRLRKAGLIDAEGNVIAPEGYDASSFDPNNPDSADRNRLMKALKGPDSRASMLRQGFDEYRADLARKKLDDFKKSTIDPLTGSISENLQRMLDNPSISLDEINAWKGQAVSQARKQESERLNRLGAALGIRGLDPGSFTGAILADRVARETDERIASSIRDLDLSVADMERRSSMEELGLGTQVSTQLAQLETALTSGNLDQVFMISNNIASLQEAIRARDEAEGLQKDANRKNLYGSIIGAAGDTLGGVL